MFNSYNLKIADTVESKVAVQLAKMWKAAAPEKRAECCKIAGESFVIAIHRSSSVFVFKADGSVTTVNQTRTYEYTRKQTKYEIDESRQVIALVKGMPVYA